MYVGRYVERCRASVGEGHGGGIAEAEQQERDQAQQRAEQERLQRSQQLEDELLSNYYGAGSFYDPDVTDTADRWPGPGLDY